MPLSGGRAVCVDEGAGPVTCQEGHVMVTDVYGARRCREVSTIAACPEGKLSFIACIFLYYLFVRLNLDSSRPDPLSDTVVRQCDKTYSCYGSRQILTSPSDNVVCLMRTAQIPIRHDTVSNDDVRVRLSYYSA